MFARYCSKVDTTFLFRSAEVKHLGNLCKKISPIWIQ